MSKKNDIILLIEKDLNEYRGLIYKAGKNIEVKGNITHKYASAFYDFFKKEFEIKVPTLPYRYLINDNNKVNYTNYYDYKNHYIEGMTVIDLENNQYTSNGIDWVEIDEDHL